MAFAYVSGVIAGDGWIDWGNASPRIGLEAKDTDFVEHFADALKLLGLKPRKIYRKDTKRFVVRATAKKEFVHSLLNWKMSLDWIPDHQISFLRGLFDSEGSVYNSKNHYVVFTNFNIKLVYLCYVLLQKLGLNPFFMRIYHFRRNDNFSCLNGNEANYWQLFIYLHKNLQLLNRMKIFTIQRKANILQRSG